MKRVRYPRIIAGSIALAAILEATIASRHDARFGALAWLGTALALSDLVGIFQYIAWRKRQGTWRSQK